MYFHISNVLLVLSWLVMIPLLYHGMWMVRSFCSMRRPPQGKKQHRFAVVIAARNEEAVLPLLIRSINNQNYPRALFDTYVIADNCTDNTARVAREAGAIVYKRHDLLHVSKGYALTWFFERFNKQHLRKYDAICIFDADNVVDRNFLHAMNDQLCVGAQAAMGFRDSKNPCDNWVSGCMSMLWWTLSRFSILPRASAGLSAYVCGTGFMFRTEYIEDGWHTTAVCEDTEFSMQLISKGARIEFAPHARFYDEQPTDWGTTINQRYRWAVGNTQCVRLSFRGLWNALKTGNRKMAFDGIMYTLLTPLVGMQTLLWLLNFVKCFFAPAELVWPMLSGALGLVLFGACCMWLQGTLVLIMEGKSLRPMLPSLLLYPVFVTTSGFISAVALFYRRTNWKPIPHTRAVPIDQVQMAVNEDGPAPAPDLAGSISPQPLPGTAES